ncbi:DUF4407 domain-containing protein [Luteolibacter sp. GHJ8]|uniref:DUF4407 domain-containing protein n=1 Tax=Luteolibacter rhizosphaerae TaxID=2989719 RepID=A0ABT3G5J1_9BACT|nr:DUF4407 domain-containing protein [Luteolibacter rhizosphaerae]MCW1915097.1 DUF4407 domain-containing protein [Luteolibacter rhizosphaerae]
MNKSNPFKRLFFWLSGAGTETLEQCPNWEQRKYVAFGATVLVPCAFAFIACSYALSTLTDNPRVIYPVAAVWAFIILTIDRALLAGYRPFLSWWRKLSQFSLRLVVAILMGLTIAHPLVLLLFRDTIQTVVEEDRSKEIATEREKFAVTKEAARGEVTKLEETIEAQREKRKETFQAKFIIQDREDAQAAIPGLTPEQQAELKTATDEATKPFRDRLDIVNTQADELSPQYTKLQSELGFWQAEFERELNGQRSGMRGEGPRARSIRADQLEPRRQESQRIGGLLEHLSAEKATLQTQVREAEKGAIATFEAKLSEIAAANKAEEDRVAALKRKVEESQADSFTEQQNSLRSSIDQQIEIRLAELKRAQDELGAVAADERARIEAIQAEPRKDILTQTLALHGLFKAGSEGGQFAFATYVVLTLLFMLVDTIPLIVKFFTKPGPYDTLLDRDEITYDAEHKAFRTSHQRYMEKVAAGNLFAVTRNKRLENALVDGVEHSRAAQEFLDSLIQMEKSFAEKIRLEQEEARHAGPEKLAALEAIKKRFYEDMQHRMEVFFAGQSA